MAERANARALAWVAAAFAGGVLLHVDRIPAWVAAVALGAIAWRLAAARSSLPLPGGIARAVLAVAVVMAVLARFHTLNGLAAGTALLILVAALKVLETRTRRDLFVVVGAALYLLLAACLDRQSLVRTPLYLAQGWLCCAALGVTASPVLSGRGALALAGRSLLLAAPLAVLLFLFFPRLTGSFWALPHGEEALTGLSDTMSPGSIGKLTTSYGVAFRVKFSGALPPPEQRYWRGPVLHLFDGSEWRRGPSMGRAREALDFYGPAYRYQVALEPSRHHWWFALDTPARAPDPRVTLAFDYELIAAQPVAEPTVYQGLSYPSTRAAAPLPEIERLEDSGLPHGRNPRSMRLAQDLRAGSPSDAAFVDAVLGYLRTGGFVYSLEPEVLGTDQVDDFLFRTRTGFCGHYASAFVTLMRAAGIPARVVTGYLGGEWNPVGNYLIVRQSDAHAWAEVWLAGRGWTRIDPTAVVEPERLRYGIADLLPGAVSVSERLLHGSPSLTRLLQRWDAANAWWNERVVKFDYSAQLDLLGRLGLHGAGTRELAWALALALAAWLTIIAWHIDRGPRPTRPDSLARAYERLCRKLARTGLPRAAHQGPIAYAEALAARGAEAAASARGLLASYAELRYGVVAPGERARRIEGFRREVGRLRVR